MIKIKAVISHTHTKKKNTSRKVMKRTKNLGIRPTGSTPLTGQVDGLEQSELSSSRSLHSPYIYINENLRESYISFEKLFSAFIISTLAVIITHI